MRERLIRVVTSVGVTEARCKFCRDRILWVTRASAPGRPARALPFNRPRPWPLEVDETESGLVIETWPASALHLGTCQGDRSRGRR